MEEKRKSGFGTASLVLGIIGICISCIPIINQLNYIVGVIAIILGIVSLLKKSSKGMAIFGVILSIVAIIITNSVIKSITTAIDQTVNEINTSMDEIAGNSTEEILKNNVDVTIGKLSVKTSYGISDTELPITVKNKSAEAKSFSIHIEAVAKDGTRIADDSVYVNSLGANQTQNFKAFTLVTSDKVKELKNATFNIVEVSMY